MCVLERETDDIRRRKGLSSTVSTRLHLIHTNPISDEKVLEGEWVLVEPKDKLIGERISGVDSK